MNHASALSTLAAHHPRAKGLGRPPSVGLAIIPLPPDVVQGVKDLIGLNTDKMKAEILAEVKEQGSEAKMYALLGGVAAGMAGVGIGVLIGRKLRR